jgi:hypothetical protein
MKQSELGRKSVAPMINGMSANQDLNMGNKKFPGFPQSQYSTKEQIQELVDDEDHSSYASRSRMS